MITGKRLSRRGLMTSAGATAATVGAASLAACGTAASSTPATDIKTMAPVTLRYTGSFAQSTMTTFGGGSQKLVEMWNERGTPVKIEPLMPSGNRNQAVLTMITAGDPPDIHHALPRDYHPFANIGSLVDLAPYIRRDKRAQDINPMILEYWGRGDARYAMPNNWSPQAIYFNKDLFTRQGLKTPDVYEKEGKWTFDTYLELAQRLTTGQGENKIYGAPWTTTALDIQLGFIWGMGGDMFNKDLTEVALDTPDSLNAIQFQGDLTHKYGVSFDAQTGTQNNWRGIGGAISAGRAGIEIMTTDVVGMLIPTTFEKGMAPLPKGKAGRVVRGNPIGAHLMKGGKNPDAGWEYLTFMSGPEGATVMLERHLTVPWLKSLLGSKEHEKLLLPWESAAAYLESSNKVRPTRYPETFADVNTAYGKAYAEVQAGRKTARQAIAEAKTAMNEALKKK